MRISDWSSDVCSSDLRVDIGRIILVGGDHRGRAHAPRRDLIDRETVMDEDHFVARPGKGAGGEVQHLVRTVAVDDPRRRSEEHTSELQSLMRISYAVFCLKKKKKKKSITTVYYPINNTTSITQQHIVQ